VALARLGRKDRVARVASFVHLAGAALFAVADQAPPTALVDGTHDVVAAILAILGVTVATLLTATTLDDDDPARRVLFMAASVFGLYGASIAVASLGPDAQGQLLLSALWSMAGVAALVVGLRRGDRTVRMGAWGLLALAVGKVFMYDLAALDSVYRVGSFMALGLLLLIGALAYQRMRPALTA
jgi:uncharacterized membrane protein